MPHSILRTQLAERGLDEVDQVGGGDLDLQTADTGADIDLFEVGGGGVDKDRKGLFHRPRHGRCDR